jgi:hypothetical protein
LYQRATYDVYAGGETTRSGTVEGGHLASRKSAGAFSGTPVVVLSIHNEVLESGERVEAAEGGLAGIFETLG